MPGLWEFITEIEWEAGVERVTGTILVFAEDLSIKLCLNDRDGGRVAFMTGQTLEDALENAEAALIEGGLDWRASKWKSRKG